ncbi:lipopolysaccharide kinase InaA family protein [Streptomyces sp. M19]
MRKATVVPTVAAVPLVAAPPTGTGPTVTVPRRRPGVHAGPGARSRSRPRFRRGSRPASYTGPYAGPPRLTWAGRRAGSRRSPCGPSVAPATARTPTRWPCTTGRPARGCWPCSTARAARGRARLAGPDGQTRTGRGSAPAPRGWAPNAGSTAPSCPPRGTPRAAGGGVAADPARGPADQPQQDRRIHAALLPTTLAAIRYGFAKPEPEPEGSWGRREPVRAAPRPPVAGPVGRGFARVRADPGTGLHALTRDHTVEEDALVQLRQDPPMTNVVCADRPFEVAAHPPDRAGELSLPCVLLTATDGFFGYVHTPAHFEWVLLRSLMGARNVAEWAGYLAGTVRAYSADDASLSLAALGYADFRALRAAFEPASRICAAFTWTPCRRPGTRTPCAAGRRRPGGPTGPLRNGHAAAAGGERVKTGDVIGGYLVVTEPTNADGGKCVWAFAEKDGTEYFLKRFLEPKRPREGSGGSAASRRIRMATCQEFEDRHRSIMKRLRPDVRGAGNLVLATDFFHEGSTYYKVTERIDNTSLEEPESLGTREKAVLLRTLGTSLKLLHAIDVVHGDLKPANVLVQKREAAAFHTAKLIDFDDSYLSGEPPGREDVAGDSLYGAPEWRRYVQGDASVEDAN